jgi:hypothetical protein
LPLVGKAQLNPQPQAAERQRRLRGT